MAQMAGSGLGSFVVAKVQTHVVKSDRKLIPVDGRWWNIKCTRQ